jgi:hypothetical protein
LAYAFIALLIVGVFVFDIGTRWWRQREWKRRWTRPDDEE